MRLNGERLQLQIRLPFGNTQRTVHPRGRVEEHTMMVRCYRLSVAAISSQLSVLGSVFDGSEYLPVSNVVVRRAARTEVVRLLLRRRYDLIKGRRASQQKGRWRG